GELGVTHGGGYARKLLFAFGRGALLAMFLSSSHRQRRTARRSMAPTRPKRGTGPSAGRVSGLPLKAARMVMMMVAGRRRGVAGVLSIGRTTSGCCWRRDSSLSREAPARA
ncbi:unnamed protein product, partial [Ectocarpus sp. 8 AP-2014]